MQSTRYNIIADQAATYELLVTWKDPNGTPIDLTDYTAKLQVRLGFSEPDAVVTVDSSFMGGITLGGEAGTIFITIDANQMSALRAPQVYVYDLRLDSAGTVTRLIDGNFTTIPAVTRV